MTTYEEKRTEIEVELDKVILDRVKRGLKWLEETHGPGWEDKIDMETLDLQNGDKCVLGQLYSEEAKSRGGDGYMYGGRMLWDERLGLHPSQDPLIHFGFCAPRLGSCSCGCGAKVNDGYTWDRLQRAWEYVLEPRVSSRIRA